MESIETETIVLLFALENHPFVWNKMIVLMLAFFSFLTYSFSEMFVIEFEVNF